MIEGRNGVDRIAAAPVYALKAGDAVVQTSGVTRLNPGNHSRMSALVKTWQMFDLSTRSLFGLVVVLSLLLSFWAAWAQFIPNPDAMLYLRAAELFSAGRWHEAVGIFRWPLYSFG